jgi:hypothetical protein
MTLLLTTDCQGKGAYICFVGTFGDNDSFYRGQNQGTEFQVLSKITQRVHGRAGQQLSVPGSHHWVVVPLLWRPEKELVEVIYQAEAKLETYVILLRLPSSRTTNQWLKQWKCIGSQFWRLEFKFKVWVQ